MKLQKVFGIVVGAHVAVLTIVMCTPGCRSTGKPKPKPEDTLAAGPAASHGEAIEATPVAPMSNNDINAGTTQVASTSATPVAPASPAAAAPAAVDFAVRFAPSRPSAIIEPAAPTPVAAAPSSHAVAKGDNLWSIAKRYGVSVAELCAANKLAPSATLHLGQSLLVPGKAAATSGPEANNTYAVKSGDTLGSIARKQGTTIASLRTANNLSGDTLRIGQKLVIPGSATPPASASAEATSTPKAGSGSHTVIPGDTLGSIARKAGVKVGELALLNNITDPAKLRVGQILKLPAGAKSIDSAKTAPAPNPAPAAGPTTAITPITPVEPGPAAIETMPVPVIRID
jgi:LysM repeat protein